MANILLLGSYGRGNLGDDAFLIAATKLFSNYDLYINSADNKLLPSPALSTVKTIHTHSYHDLIKKIKLFLTSRNIVYWGGDLWVELDGERFPRKSLYKMLALNILAKMFFKNVHYFGCGIGELQGYSLNLAKASALMASTIIVRDNASKKLLSLKRANKLSDLTVLLDYPDKKRKMLSKKITIGISVLYSIPETRANFPKLIDKLATFIKSLDENKYQIMLYPMLVSENYKYNDLWASKLLMSTVNQNNVVIYRGRRVKPFIDSLSNLDLMIGCRLHANILATLAGTPCIGISYRSKVKNFFKDNGLGECYLGVDELDSLAKIFSQKMLDYSHFLKATNHAKKRMLNDKEEYYKILKSSEL